MCFQVLRSKYAYMCILESFGAVFVHQMDCICLEGFISFIPLNKPLVAANTWQRKECCSTHMGAHGMGRNCVCFVVEMMKHVCV
ncbi:hypothetical protein DVH24_036046 [Malus domestica]|uniref:Uncharacterized protein n=1 Tax=Malus domestica TaxID=3750 RepID=A0A498JNQ1_MALDO|nr:hypothetical protein DVH24_036046 [Malus domestica]